MTRNRRKYVVIAALALLIASKDAAIADPPTTPGPADSNSPAPPGVTPADQPAGPQPEPPKNVVPLEAGQAVAILGKKVRGPDGKDVIGPVVDVLVGEDGQPRAAVIDIGGFLGVGSRKIAVDWHLLTFKPAERDAPLVLALARGDMQAVPEYKDSAAEVDIVEPPAPAPAPAAESTPHDAEQ